MVINMYIYKYKNYRLNLFKWIYELNFLNKLILSFSFACLTGLLAQLRFYIPGTPVPVTGQVFGVVLSGVLLGVWGGVSQLMYLGIGTMGVPWFTNFNSGIAYMSGPTGGYLAGFIVAAFFIGFIVERYARSLKIINMTLLMFFTTFFLIYIPGIIWFYFWSGSMFSLGTLISMCVLPFIAADFVKAAVASSIALCITPKSSFRHKIHN